MAQVYGFNWCIKNILYMNLLNNGSVSHKNCSKCLYDVESFHLVFFLWLVMVFYTKLKMEPEFYWGETDGWAMVQTPHSNDSTF